jgi:hypothetical protein
VKQDVNKLYDQNYLQHVLQDVDKVFDGAYQHKVGGDFDFNIGGHNFQTSVENMEVNAANTTISGGDINLNGPDASTASEASEASEAELPQRLKLHTIVDLTSQDEWQSLISTESIVRRMPTPEPYPHHENLDPLNYKPDKLDRDIEGRYESTDGEELEDQSDFTNDMNTPPDAWRVYSTTTDTFAKVPSANQQPPEEE